MKRFGKFLIAAIVLMVGCVASSFAFDDDAIQVAYCGNETREAFSYELETTDVEEVFGAMLEGQGLSIYEFLEAGVDMEIDDELEDLLAAIEGKIVQEARANDVYVGMVFSDIDPVNQSVAGYWVMSHVASKKDVASVMYYFEAGF